MLGENIKYSCFRPAGYRHVDYTHVETTHMEIIHMYVYVSRLLLPWLVGGNVLLRMSFQLRNAVSGRENVKNTVVIASWLADTHWDLMIHWRIGIGKIPMIHLAPVCISQPAICDGNILRGLVSCVFKFKGLRFYRGTNTVRVQNTIWLGCM